MRRCWKSFQKYLKATLDIRSIKNSCFSNYRLHAATLKKERSSFSFTFQLILENTEVFLVSNRLNEAF